MQTEGGGKYCRKIVEKNCRKNCGKHNRAVRGGASVTSHADAQHWGLAAVSYSVSQQGFASQRRLLLLETVAAPV